MEGQKGTRTESPPLEDDSATELVHPTAPASLTTAAVRWPTGATTLCSAHTGSKFNRERKRLVHHGCTWDPFIHLGLQQTAGP